MQNMNNAYFSGKIYSMLMTPKGELKLKLSIAQSKRGKDGKRELRQDENGSYVRSIITIRFLGELAKKINNNYRPGDYVNVTAVAQTVRNHYSCTNKIEMWGINVSRKGGARFSPLYDINNVTLRGKVTSVYELTSGSKLVTIYTSVEKNVLTPSMSMMPQTFTSYTTVNVGKNFECKKGDYINVSGFVIERTQGHGYNRSVSQIIYSMQSSKVEA